MVIVILKGTKSTKWNLDNRFRDAGVPIDDLSETELTKAEKEGLIDYYLDEDRKPFYEREKKTVQKAPTKPKAKVLTEKEAFVLSKAEQLDLLAKLGVEPSEANNNFRLEANRVKAILGAQK